MYIWGLNMWWTWGERRWFQDHLDIWFECLLTVVMKPDLALFACASIKAKFWQICPNMTSFDIDLAGENEKQDRSHEISSTTIKVDHQAKDLFRTDFVTFCPGNCATLPSSCLRDKADRVSQEIRSSKLLNFTTMRTLSNRNLSFRSSLKLDVAEYQVHVNVHVESSTTDLDDELRVSTLPLRKQKKLQCNMKNTPSDRSLPARKFSESGVPLLRAERGRHVKSPVDTPVQKVIKTSLLWGGRGNGFEVDGILINSHHESEWPILYTFLGRFLQTLSKLKCKLRTKKHFTASTKGYLEKHKQCSTQNNLE